VNGAPRSAKLTRRALGGLALAGVAWSGGAAAATDPVADAFARIAKARAGVKTLTATFKQKRVVGLLASEVDSTGKLALVRPDRLRWELEPPDQVIYWIGPEGIAMTTGDGVVKIGKAAAGRFAAVLGDLLVMLGGDLDKLRVRYRIAAETRDGRMHLRFEPKDEALAKQLRVLRLVAPSDRAWAIERTEIEDANGDKSLIDFAGFQKNASIDPETMKPPKR
jgi:outer membrane lipoprotein-sorting protein